MHILIVKMSSLGDIIHAFPVVECLKQRYPDAIIDWVVEKPFAELVRAHPLVNQVLCIQTKKWRGELFHRQTRREVLDFRDELRKTEYTMVLDLQGNMKSGLVTKCARSPVKVGFGWATVHEWPNFFVTNKRFNPPLGGNVRDENLFLAQSAIQDFSLIQESGVKLTLNSKQQAQLQPIIEALRSETKLKVMVCPGSNWANKQLSEETLLQFLQTFKKNLPAHFVIVWGSQGEKELADRLVEGLPNDCTVIDRLPLPALQNLMTQVDLVLAMDSLPLHLAGTTSTPTYSVFGASSAHKYKPVGHQHRAFQGTCPYGKTFERRCDVLRTCKTGSCIKDLEGSVLFHDFHEWWRDKDKGRGS